MTIEQEKAWKKLLQTKYVYHYTSFETIFALLYGYHLNGDNLLFHASNIYKVNDPNEMIVGFDMIKEILINIEEVKQVAVEKKLSEVYNDEEYVSKCKEDYLYGKGLNETNNGIIPYIISFTKHGDYLPMWSLYGAQGKGVCLKMDTSVLIDSDLANSFHNVHYDKGSLVLIEQDVSLMYDLYLRQHTDENTLSIETKIFELATIYLAVAPYFKHKDYKYEAEYRMVYNKCYSLPHKIIERPCIDAKTKIEPFVNIAIPINALKGILIGPDANYDVMSHILSLELKDCGINPHIIKRSHINYKQNK